MIVVRVCKSILGIANPTTHEVDWTGQTYRQLVETHRRREWGREVPLTVCANGAQLDDANLDCVAADNVLVSIAPRPEGEVGFTFVTLLIFNLIISGAAITYQLLTRPNLRPPQNRGDESSATYAWDGVATEYRPGFAVPLVYGEHDVGGQVVFLSVVPQPITANQGLTTEHLVVVLALCEGRIESIGEVTGGDIGELDFMGGFPGQAEPAGPAIPRDIRINGNRLNHEEGLPGARAFVRMGEVTQSALPSNPFAGAQTTQVVGEDLNAENQSGTATIGTGGEEIGLVTCILAFPNGLYSVEPNGNHSSYPVDFRVEWRFPGQAWVVAHPNVNIDFGRTTGFSRAVPFAPTTAGGQPVTGPIEVRVTRLTGQGGTNRSSACVFRQVTWRVPHTFAYPRTALLGLQVEANDKLSGGRPTFTVRIRGKRVRVYDDTHGLSTDRYWLNPTTGDYAGIWDNHPGRNPAWILADFLTSPEGLGAQFTDANIDWPAFRDWADYCDASVAIGEDLEARFQFDGVLDAQTSAWEWCLRIARAGRGVPVIEGTKVTVKYEYAGAHGQGTNSVPAKVRKRTMTAASMADFRVEYLNPAFRPAVLVYQILNREKDYAHDPISVEDPDGGFNDPRTQNPLPFTKETIELFGVTRPSQARREGLYTHRINRLIRSKVSFRAPVEALDLNLGDVIGIQNDAFQPFGSKPIGCRMSRDADGDNIWLDHDVTLAPATTYAVVLVQDDGTVVNATVTSAAGTYPADTALTIDETPTCSRGSPVAFGITNEVVKDYVISNLTLNEDLTRTIEALEWVPAVYADDNVGQDLADESTDGTLDRSNLYSLQQVVPPQVESITVRRMPGDVTLVGWDSPDGYRSRPARVYARHNDGTTAGAWWLLGQSATGQLEFTPPLAVGRRYDVAVAVADQLGNYQLPGEAASVSYVGEEWPWVQRPPNVHGLGFVQLPDEGVELFWDPVQVADFAYYEVRAGESWLGGQVVYRGHEPRCLVRQPARGPYVYWVAVRLTSGLYSPKLAATGAGASWFPAGSVVALTRDEMSSWSTPPPERFGGLEFEAGELQLVVADHELEGFFETDEFDPGFAEDTAAWWSVYWDARELDNATVGDLAGVLVGSGESLWRRVAGREASIGQPGISWGTTVGDLAGTLIGDLDNDILFGHRRGSPGSHSRVLVESRLFVGGVWTSYVPHRNRWARGTKMQVRVRMGRSEYHRSTQLRQLVLEARVGA